MNAWKRVVPVILLSMSSACSSVVIEPDTMPMGIDTTVGRAVMSTDRQTILVTMTDEIHAQLTQGQSVRYEGRLPPLYARFLAQMYRDYGLERVADWPLGTLGVRCFVFETDAAVSESFINTIEAHHLVETAQPMQYFAVSDNGSYDDPYIELQAGYSAMQVADSHSWSTGKGVLIAVIDTGLDSKHVDLKNRIVGIRNFVDRSYADFHSDIHGTAVAGVIAASANNGNGIAGVAPESLILGLKACAQSQPGDRAATCNSFTLAKALDFAISERADIINLSLAGPRDPLLERLVVRAQDAGTIVVGARGRGVDHSFPSDVQGVIGVASAASDAEGATILAPGTQVVTTVPGNGYDFFTGSSFAAAHVSGVVALVRQRKPHLSADVVHQLLQIATDETTGYANACQAMSRIVGGDCTPAATINADSNR